MGESVGGEDADRDGLVAVVKVLGLRQLRRQTSRHVRFAMVNESTDAFNNTSRHRYARQLLRPTFIIHFDSALTLTVLHRYYPEVNVPFDQDIRCTSLLVRWYDMQM